MRFTSWHMKQATELYATGLSCRVVAARLARVCDPFPSHTTVFDWVQAAGILRTRSRAMELRETRRLGKDFDGLRRRARFLAVEKLWSVRQIARHLGASRNFVTRAIPASCRCNASMATLRRKWQAYLPDVERRRSLRDAVVLMRERGESYHQIKEKTGLSPATIYLYSRSNGLTKSNRAGEARS